MFCLALIIKTLNSNQLIFVFFNKPKWDILLNKEFSLHKVCQNRLKKITKYPKENTMWEFLIFVINRCENWDP
jgi:hypothetical protein